ncbi:MAG: DUF2240 family protein [Nanoarchaeota archaeon]|nr:DUF2240 family protein [Nanoarchaeota archaeon]
MIRIPYEDILQKITDNSNLSKDDIETKIKQKTSQLSGLISKEGAAHIVANELGIKLLDGFTGKLQVKNILPGMRNVETVGKAVEVHEVREFTSNKRQGKVGSLVVGDETGTIRVVMWNDQAKLMESINKGDVIKIIGGYVRDNSGRKEIHINDRSKLTINPEGVTVEVKEPESTRKSIKDLSESDSDAELVGTIVQVFDPNFFEVCPTCGKRAKPEGDAFKCATHGAVTPDFSYVTNVFLDDGTENLRVVFFRNQTEQLTKKTKAEIMGFKDKPETFEQVKTDLLGTIIKVQGRVTKNQMFDRLELVANKVNPDIDPEEEIKHLQGA